MFSKAHAQPCPKGLVENKGHCVKVNSDGSILPIFKITPENLKYLEFINYDYSGDAIKFPIEVDWDLFYRKDDKKSALNCPPIVGCQEEQKSESTRTQKRSNGTTAESSAESSKK